MRFSLNIFCVEYKCLHMFYKTKYICGAGDRFHSKGRLRPNGIVRLNRRVPFTAFDRTLNLDTAADRRPALLSAELAAMAKAITSYPGQSAQQMDC